MIYSTATVPVNPQGELILSRARIWAGLEIKARDARLFCRRAYDRSGWQDMSPRTCSKR